MVRAAFPFTSRPFTPDPTTLPITINTSGGGSVDPFPLINVSTMPNRPTELKQIVKVVVQFATPVTFGANAQLVLGYFAADGTKIIIFAISTGIASDVLMTPPNTGPLLGSGEFPFLEATGNQIDDKIVNLAEIHLGLDR